MWRSRREEHPQGIHHAERGVAQRSEELNTKGERGEIVCTHAYPESERIRSHVIRDNFELLVEALYGRDPHKDDEENHPERGEPDEQIVPPSQFPLDTIEEPENSDNEGNGWDTRGYTCIRIGRSERHRESRTIVEDACKRDREKELGDEYRHSTRP